MATSPIRTPGPSSDAPHPPRPVIVVGAGVGGLVCALELERAGGEVLLLEREREPGGRVRSRRVDGFTVDLGFQVLFEAYPTLAAWLDLDALDMRWFRPAARLRHAGRVERIGDGLRDPSLLVDTMRARALPVADKLRLLALTRRARRRSVDECFAPDAAGATTRDFLERAGFGRKTIDRFFAPFHGGILLDRALSTSASLLLFTLKMLAEGRTGVPAAGMGAIPRQLAQRLRPGTLRTGVAVEGIVAHGGAVRGVRTSDGATIEASEVVVATDAAVARRLLATGGADVPLPEGRLGCTTLWLAGARSPIPGDTLWLGDPASVVCHAATMTDVAPEYGDGARALVAATIVGADAEREDDALVALVRRDLGRIGGADAGALACVAVTRVPWSQYPQPPGVARPATSATDVTGLRVAGEMLHSSSLEGAARGGRIAARELLAPTAR